MLFVNQYSHVPFLKRELRQLLPEGSFASRLKLAIGYELHVRLVEWEPQSEVEYSKDFPVDALFTWIMENGGLDPEWLAYADGSYFDDKGEKIPSLVKPSFSGVEQLAAYGVWFLEEMLDCCGSIPEKRVNEQGFKRDEVIEHRAACMLLAYQALSYARRILNGTQLTAEEIALGANFNFSAMGKVGAEKRHAPMAALRVWAIEKYKEREWKSANLAAHALKESVIEHGRKINVHLSEANAQRTIAEWFRKSV